MAQSRVSIHALSRPELLAGGITEARAFLDDVGADGGLELPPLRFPRRFSTLVRAIHAGANSRMFNNIVDGKPLVGSLQHPFAPTLPEALKRQYGRVLSGELNPAQGLWRFALNIGQRAVMPPARRGLPAMGRLARSVGDKNLFAVVPPDAFFLKDGKPKSYAGKKDLYIPYERVAQVSPDLSERLNEQDVGSLPPVLRELGATAVSLDPFHLKRRSQSGETALSPISSWLHGLMGAMPVRQIGVSIYRDDMPPASGKTAAIESRQLGDALVSDNPKGKQYDQLSAIAQTVRETQPQEQLAITVVGSLGGLSVGQIATIVGNLKQI